jgi:hypothetical protein
MRSQRCTEAEVLGYSIERLDEFDDAGMLHSMRYEVLCPRTGAVLANLGNVQAAKRFVIVHELRVIREGTLRLNKNVREGVRVA